jgi:hypothetical protein
MNRHANNTPKRVRTDEPRPARRSLEDAMLSRPDCPPGATAYRGCLFYKRGMYDRLYYWAGDEWRRSSEDTLQKV